MEHFKLLNETDISKYAEKKKTGKTLLSYLPWADAWTEIKKIYPDATYNIKRFANDLPYVFDENTGYMVFTDVTIEGITHEMWLPVMDNNNNAMRHVPYTIVYTNSQQEVKTATMFDVNKAIMRCLTKNLAMFGLGLSLYRGEDLPDDNENLTPTTNAKTYNNGAKEMNYSDVKTELNCSACLKEITTAEAQYSLQNYGKKLCRSCQKSATPIKQ